MNSLHNLPLTTQRRLQRIPQTNSVWEGDRRHLSGLDSTLETGFEGSGEFIIWVDGSEGLVRAMDMVSAEMGPEAVVRTLVRAMENPHSPGKPGRPQKIVVSDRELQFFLRGALQNLNINIDYVPHLPLIDELFRDLEAISSQRPPQLPASYEKLLTDTAAQIWSDDPWDFIADHQILEIKLNHTDFERVYACILGMLGKEYGIVLYRSLDSLQRFRRAILAQNSLEFLEREFLAQDCWFLNFEAKDFDDEDDEDFDLADLPPSEITPVFGSLHPYEGIRPFLDEEEANIVYLALESLRIFCEEFEDALSEETSEKISQDYYLSVPLQPEKVSVTVSNLPELSSELLTMLEEQELRDDEADFNLRNDLIPEKSLIRLDIIPGEIVEILQKTKKIQGLNAGNFCQGKAIPVILVQTSRPKAKRILEDIEVAGGIEAICFNPGEDPILGTDYDLGIVKAVNGDLYILAEFISDDPHHLRMMKKWQQACQNNHNYCALLIAMGVTGASAGKPQVKDLIALLPTKLISGEELGIGMLQLMPQENFEFYE